MKKRRFYDFLIPENAIRLIACLAVFLFLWTDVTIADDKSEQGKEISDTELVQNLCMANPQFGNDGWDDSCGSGVLPDFMSTQFDPNINLEGNWIEEYRMEDTLVAVRHIALWKMKIGYGALVGTPSRQDRIGPWYSSQLGGWSSDKNGKKSGVGIGPNWSPNDKNAKFSMKGLRKAILNKIEPDQMSGTWTIDDNSSESDKKGTVISRKVLPRIDRIKFIGDNVTEISFGDKTGKLEFTYQGPVYGNARSNRRKVHIEVYGENLWGFHRMWIDPIHNLQLLGASYIQGEADSSGFFNSIVGIRFGFVTWQDMFPGKKTLWVDDIPIPFELVLNNFPKERLATAERINAAIQQ